MAKSDAFETALLELIFNATPIAGLADNAASDPLTNLYISLHTDDPGEDGDQESNEISYTGYSRVAVARSGSGWTVSGNSVSPVAAITFGEMTDGTGGTVTHVAIGTEATGAGSILYSGAVTPQITVSEGVTPVLKNTSTITES